MKVADHRSEHEVLGAGRLVFVQERLVKNSNHIAPDVVVDPEAVFLLGKDAATVVETTQGVLNGSEKLLFAPATATEKSGFAVLAELVFAENSAADAIFVNMKPRIEIKQAAQSTIVGTDSYFLMI